MTEGSGAAQSFTEKLLRTVREQRRVVIATQQPSINTQLLDLCSITMVHRCTSPAWFKVLKQHVAALYLNLPTPSVEASDMAIDLGSVYISPSTSYLAYPFGSRSTSSGSSHGLRVRWLHTSVPSSPFLPSILALFVPVVFGLVRSMPGNITMGTAYPLGIQASTIG